MPDISEIGGQYRSMKFQVIIILLTLLYMSPLNPESGNVIKKIEHRGLKKTKESLVDYYRILKEQELFDPSVWDIEKNRFLDLDIFADVSLEVKKGNDGTELVYNYVELPSYIIFPAMKRTDQDGLLMGPGLTFTNILGLGIHQELLNRFTVAPEPLRAKEFLTYTYIPEMYSLPFTTEVTINYFHSYNTLKLYNEKSLYSEASFIYRLGKITRLEVSCTSLWVKHDNNSPYFTETESDKSIRMFRGGGEWDYLPSLGTGLIFDTRNRKMNPHSGFYNEVMASVYGEKLGGDSDFMEYLYDFRGYIPASDKQIIHGNLLARYRPGTIPAYELYHIGGVNSLRTYEPDPSICDQHEVLWTVEYRYELFTNRQVSLFDMHAYYGLQLVAGMDNALFWFPGDEFLEGQYLNSFYAGIHLLVPVLERIRLEFGFHGPYRDEKEIRFGVNLGWYEKAYTQRRRVR